MKKRHQCAQRPENGTTRARRRPEHEDNLNDARAPSLLPRQIATLSHTALVVKKQRPVPRPEMGRWPIAVLHCPVARVSGSGVGSALLFVGSAGKEQDRRHEPGDAAKSRHERLGVPFAALNHIAYRRCPNAICSWALAETRRLMNLARRSRHTWR